jgi:uncharacterized membrane protein
VNPQTPVPAARTRRLHALALGSYLLLILLTILWEGWLAPKGPPGLWLTVKSLPLLLPLFGLLHGRLRSHILASLLVLLYLTEGLVLMWTAPPAGFASGSPWPWAVAEILLSLAFFVSASFYVRRRRHAGESLA